MDFKTWCGLCGSLEAILKLDDDQESIVQKMTEEIHLGNLICLECVTFLNACIEFSKRSKHIQTMFEEVKNCNDKDQINALRIFYDLQPVETIEEDHSFNQIQQVESADVLDSIVIFEEEDNDVEIDEEFMIEEHLEENALLTDEHKESFQAEKMTKSRARLFKGEDVYKCNECKLNYKTQQAYDKHMKNKHGENSTKFICSVCGRSFKEKQILKNHEKIHLPDEEKLKYPCKFCEKKFINSHCLKVHVARIHEKISYFFCEICGKGCTTKSDLLWHMDKHTQERNYSCDLCGLKFKSTNSLRNHKRRHEAIELNKQCSVCKKEFRSTTALNNHKLVHSNERRYQCQYCQNSYKRLETYKCHLSSHTGIRPFKCQWCSRTFINAANCRKHKLKDHPKEVEEYEAIHGKRGVSLAFKS